MVLRFTRHRNRQLVAEGIRGVTMNGDVWLHCPVCRELKPIELRKTADGVVRNQPRCSTCRGGRKSRRRMTQLAMGFTCLALVHCGGESFTEGSPQNLPQQVDAAATDGGVDEGVHLDPPAPSSDGGQEASDANEDEKGEASNVLDSGPETGPDAAPYCFFCYGVKVCAPCCIICQGGTYCAPGCAR